LPTANKFSSVTILVFAQIAGMGLWFTSSAILGDMAIEAVERGIEFTPLAQALMSAMVQAGFVVGALLSAILGLADRYDPRRFFLLSSLVAASANLFLLVLEIGSFGSIVVRLITGFALAGVYPVGLKIAAGWGDRDRGFLVGLLVGALTFGSAMPHLFAFLGGADWRTTVTVASLVALLGGISILRSGLGPFHAKAAEFNWRAGAIIWKDAPIRAAFLGYLGHMWELYAMWAWIGAALLSAYMADGLILDGADSQIKLIVFLIIAVGAVSCAIGGKFADRIGKVDVTIIAMAISALAAVATGLSLGGPFWITVIFALIWGAAVIPDSPQFSAIIADHAPKELVGSLLSIQTATGFLLTVFTVQVTPLVASEIGWRITLCLMAVGPILGIAAMWKMRGR